MESTRDRLRIAAPRPAFPGEACADLVVLLAGFYVPVAAFAVDEERFGHLVE